MYKDIGLKLPISLHENNLKKEFTLNFNPPIYKIYDLITYKIISIKQAAVTFECDLIRETIPFNLIQYQNVTQNTLISNSAIAKINLKNKTINIVINNGNKVHIVPE